MANPPGWKEVHEYKHPGNSKVRLTLFWTNNVTHDPAPTYLTAAENLLSKHGLGLDVNPARQKQQSATIVYSESIFDSNRQGEELRKLADAPDSFRRLIVIFCVFRAPLGGDPEARGITLADTSNFCFLPFVLIDTSRQSPDGLTLLHEIGHAAGLKDEPKGSKDAVANFMTWDSSRNDMRKNQVIAIANSFFCK